MNNEPVAWIDEINTFVLDKDYQQFPKSLQHGMIPLYTHPIKDLTDEDYKEALACLKFALDDTMDYLTLNNLGGENNHWLVWARAILRKAQEKCNGFCGEYECKENQSNCKRKAQEK